MRVAIATGSVVVGDLIGQGASQEQAVVGETPNLAARLQALAEPDAVVIASSTRRLTGGLFDYEDLGAVEIKGLAMLVKASRVVRESAGEGRFAALRTADHSFKAAVVSSPEPQPGPIRDPSVGLAAEAPLSAATSETLAGSRRAAGESGGPGGFDRQSPRQQPPPTAADRCAPASFARARPAAAPSNGAA